MKTTLFNGAHWNAGGMCDGSPFGTLGADRAN